MYNSMMFLSNDGMGVSGEGFYTLQHNTNSQSLMNKAVETKQVDHLQWYMIAFVYKHIPKTDTAQKLSDTDDDICTEHDIRQNYSNITTFDSGNTTVGMWLL